MNLLDMLKTANIFSPTGITTPQQFPVGSIGGPVDTSQPQPINTGPDLSAAIQGLLNPRDEQFNNFAQMIQSMPQRQDYQPSLLRRIGATIAGMGTGSPVGISGGAVLGYKSNVPEGLKVQQAINEQPYSQALNDWANKLGPTEKIAQMEQNRNVGNRATALGAIQRQQAQEKLDEQERRNLELEEQGRTKLGIQQERADAYVKSKQFAIEHPEYKTAVDEDGTLWFYNPQDPTAAPIDSGLKKLSEMEKIDLGVQGELKKIAARSSASQSMEAKRQANRKELEGQRQINRLELKTTPSGNSGIGKPLTPTATAQDRVNKAIEIINARPELGKYFVRASATNNKPTGELQIPKGGDPKEIEFIRAQMGANIKLPGQGTIPPEVNPQLNIQPQSRELTRSTPPTESAQMKAARAKVEKGYVLITDGKSFGQIKPEDASKLPAGWSVVK